MEEKIDKEEQIRRDVIDILYSNESLVKNPRFMFLRLAVQELFNQKHGIVTPESIYALEPKSGGVEVVGEEGLMLRLDLASGKTVEITNDLPPQGKINGVEWFGIIDFVSKILEK